MRKALFIMCVLLFGFTAVAEEKATKELYDKIIGSWTVDKESIKEFLKEQGQDEEAIEFALGMMGDTEIEFDGSTMKSLSGGAEQEMPYTVESQDGNVLELKGEDESLSKITFVDDDTIELSSEGTTLKLTRNK